MLRLARESTSNMGSKCSSKVRSKRSIAVLKGGAACSSKVRSKRSIACSSKVSSKRSIAVLKGGAASFFITTPKTNRQLLL